MTPEMAAYVDLERALRAGDMAAAQAAVPAFPHGLDPYTHVPLLSLAISWAPVDCVRTMLAAGADPNYVAADGFPALVAAALSGRPDRVELLGVLVAAGADLAARGVNDWTPLHAAASVDDPEAVALLLAAGADSSLRTSIDDRATALEEAEQLGNTRAAAVLRGGT
ncbi:MAG: uncharacterized protein QOE99_1723 [Actinomycetota bacterium]|jgi:ankyrin repeat protein|nr:uncharacterized protein [Actinomycetota bacterium]